jgi:hypothetical protein
MPAAFYLNACCARCSLRSSARRLGHAYCRNFGPRTDDSQLYRRSSQAERKRATANRGGGYLTARGAASCDISAQLFGGPWRRQPAASCGPADRGPDQPGKPSGSEFRALSWSSFQFPDSGEDGLLLWGRSERASAMIRRLSNVKIVVPTAFAVALAIVLSIGAIDLTEIFLGPIEQVEAHQTGSR